MLKLYIRLQRWKLERLIMIKRIMDHFFEILSFIIGIIGIVATVVSAFAGTDTGMWYVYFVVLATESLLAIIWGWNLKIKYSYQENEKELQNKIEEANDQIDYLNSEIEKEKTKYLDKEKLNNKFFATIISNIKNASKLNNELCNRIPEINEKAYHLLETLQNNDTIDVDTIRSELQKSYEDFSIGLFDLFKRYTSNLLNCIVASVEAYLKMNELSNKVSVTIKLFDKPLYSIDNKDDILVYTAFRDKCTYDQHEREIGEEPYTILGNADFVQCLTKDHFIINNANKNSQSYANEHVDFDLYYNCAVVVALRVKQADGSMKYLGYLCCDTLNTDLSKEVFDKEVAQLLFSMAQLYATFLETLDSNWIDRMQDNFEFEQNFLELICKKKYHGKKR